jgi:hypothetical protein
MGEKPEYGWVIEMGSSPASAPWYFSIVGVKPGWSTDDLCAFRFAREKDAKQFADAFIKVPVRVAEHAWG